MAKLTKGAMTLLAAIGTATEANQPYYVPATPDAKALATFNPPLIEVNGTMPDPTDANKAAARITDAGKAMLANGLAGASVVQSGPADTASDAGGSQFAIITNAELPKSKRTGGGTGAPVKYPFAVMQVGQTFFVPATDKKPNPAKSLGSTISKQNLEYATETGKKTVTRSKRGPKNKALLDGAGNKVMETVDVPVYEYQRKFTVRPVEVGKSYGGWTAPSNGALIGRVK